MGGLQIYVFSFTATGMDESGGYCYLAEVPELYLAHTDGQGTIWVEPLSGTVVDYEDSGVTILLTRRMGTGSRISTSGRRNTPRRRKLPK